MVELVVFFLVYFICKEYYIFVDSSFVKFSKGVVFIRKLVIYKKEFKVFLIWGIGVR